MIDLPVIAATCSTVRKLLSIGVLQTEINPFLRKLFGLRLRKTKWPQQSRRGYLCLILGTCRRTKRRQQHSSNKFGSTFFFLLNTHYSINTIVSSQLTSSSSLSHKTQQSAIDKTFLAWVDKLRNTCLATSSSPISSSQLGWLCWSLPTQLVERGFWRWIQRVRRWQPASTKMILFAVCASIEAAMWGFQVVGVLFTR